MRKDSKTSIKVAKVLASIIGSRDVISVLKSHVFESDKPSVVLDFESIQFISRSAAHELLLFQEELRQKGKELVFDNTNKDIVDMLRIVAANRAVPAKKSEFKPEKVDINSLREELAL